jgi:hypothetical protein
VSGRRKELDRALAVVSFAPPERLPAYARDLGLEGVDLYSDPERAAYAAFGFDRASLARTYLDPRVWGSYAGLLARGRRAGAPQEDTLQLGGDVLVDAGGTIRWIYHSDGPEDRPSVDEILAAG